MIESSLPILVFEGLVAVLLLGAAVLCWRVDRRLANLRSGQDGVRAAIADLVAATEEAQRTIRALQSGGAETAKALEVQIKTARALADELRLTAPSAVRTEPREDREPPIRRRLPPARAAAPDLEALR